MENIPNLSAAAMNVTSILPVFQTGKTLKTNVLQLTELLCLPYNERTVKVVMNSRTANKAQIYLCKKKGVNTMKIINKIKAFFTHHDEPVELDLVAAEIRAGKAFLHPRGEENVTYLVRSDDIEITLSKGRSLNPTDIFKTGPKEKNISKDLKQLDNKDAKQPPAQTPKDSKPTKPPMETTQTAADEFDRFKKRKFVVSLYPDEYDTIMSSMKEYGYKRADFVLACVNSAAKGTMEKAHKKIVKSHNEIRKEQQAFYAKRQTEN